MQRNINLVAIIYHFCLIKRRDQHIGLDGNVETAFYSDQIEKDQQITKEHVRF